MDNKQVVMYKGDAEAIEIGYKLDEGTLPEGITDESYFLRDLFEFFETHDNLRSSKDFKEFAKLVDIDSAMDYFAVQVWMHNKWDWPGKNWIIWKTAEVDPSNPYADGCWRFSLHDLDFPGSGGRGDAGVNTIEEDDLLDMESDNVMVLCFSYLMSNKDFRADFYERLDGLTDGIMEKKKALDLLEEFSDTYEPLLDQFFDRYPGTGNTRNAIHGGYISADCIKDFIRNREGTIEEIIKWTKKQY